MNNNSAMRNDSGMTDEQEEVLYESQEFQDYIYENRNIGNGHALVEAMEDTTLFDAFLRDRGSKTVSPKHWANFEKMVDDYMKSPEYINSEG